MATQLFYFSTTHNRFATPVALFALLIAEDMEDVESMPLTSHTALVQITYTGKRTFLPSDLMPPHMAKCSWMIELVPEQLGVMLEDNFCGSWPELKGHGLSRKQEDGSIHQRSNITERLANRVLDRISKLGLDGITSFERCLLERYSEDLRLPENPSKHRP